MNYSVQGERSVKMIVCAYDNSHRNNPIPGLVQLFFWDAQNFYVAGLEWAIEGILSH